MCVQPGPTQAHVRGMLDTAGHGPATAVSRVDAQMIGTWVGNLGGSHCTSRHYPTDGFAVMRLRNGEEVRGRAEIRIVVMRLEWSVVERCYWQGTKVADLIGRARAVFLGTP